MRLPFSAQRRSLSLLAAALCGLAACSDRPLPTSPATPSEPQAMIGGLLSPASSPFEGVLVTGTYAGGTFQGRYDVLNFFVDTDAKLKAEVRLRGTVLDARGRIVTRVNVRLNVAAHVLESTSTRLRLELGAAVAKLANVNVSLRAVLIVVDPATHDGLVNLGLLKTLLGKIVAAVDGSVYELVDELNECLDLFNCGALICL